MRMPKPVFPSFNAKVEELLTLGKPRIAFGLLAPDERILRSLRSGRRHADIVLVGPDAIRAVRGFELIVDAHPEEKLAELLATDAVEGIIRGTLDDFTTYEAYQRRTGERYTIGPGLFEDPSGRQFFLSPASNPEGWSREERLRIAAELAEFVRPWGIEPRIAVFTGERHETYPRKKHITEGVVGILNRTYEDAEWIIAELRKRGFEAKNWAIDLDLAVGAGYNVLIPVNGMVGNQIFRVLLFCGGRVLACTRLGLSRFWEDNSRNETDYQSHVRWLVALINQRKQSRSSTDAAAPNP